MKIREGVPHASASFSRSAFGLRRIDPFHESPTLRTGQRRSLIAAELVTAVDALVDE